MRHFIFTENVTLWCHILFLICLSNCTSWCYLKERIEGEHRQYVSDIKLKKKNLDIYQLKMVFSFMRSIFLIKTWIIKKKNPLPNAPTRLIWVTRLANFSFKICILTIATTSRQYLQSFFKPTLHAVHFSLCKQARTKYEVIEEARVTFCHICICQSNN